MRKALEFDKIEIRGELSYRIIKSFARLEEKEYRPDVIHEMDQAGWPGDWEGRTMLAWILLARLTKRTPAYLKEVKYKQGAYFNQKMYFGEILKEGTANEQQLSGHNWFLRALLEEYLWTGDEDCANLAKQIVENLYLPVKELYKDYPIEASSRCFLGKASGEIIGEIQNGWYLSSDIGCAFMCMDALSQYYQIFEDSRVALLLDEMIAKFQKIDFVKSKVQTHASLTAVRAMLRYYLCCYRKELLNFAMDFFELYCEKGMTENYANYNWFDKPDWTETCAVVDSYLLAVELFKITGNVKYIKISNRIYYNALGYEQRQNGGFGCDKCTGAWEHPEMLITQPGGYEAYWCCTMRGGAGLVRVASHAIMTEGNTCFFANYIPMSYRDDKITFSVETEYPRKGMVEILVTKCKEPHAFQFYIPEGVLHKDVRIQKEGNEIKIKWYDEIAEVRVNGVGKIILEFPIWIHKEGTVNKQLEEAYFTLWHGDLMLGLQKGNHYEAEYLYGNELKNAEYLGDCTYKLEDKIVEAINRSIYYTQEELLNRPYQILYPKEKGKDHNEA